jgi:hypothetical protein
MICRWGGRLTFLAPGVSVAVLGTHMIHPLPVVTPEKDRVTRLAERQNVANDLYDHLKAHGQSMPLFTPEYQWAARLRFAGVRAEHEPDVTRPSHFTQVGGRLSDHDAVYYFSNFPLPAGHADGFERAELVTQFPLVVRGEVYDTYKLWLYRKPPRTPPDPRVSVARRVP